MGTPDQAWLGVSVMSDQNTNNIMSVCRKNCLSKHKVTFTHFWQATKYTVSNGYEQITGYEITRALLVRLCSNFYRTSKGSNYHKLPLLTKSGLCTSVGENFIFFDGEIAWDRLWSVLIPASVRRKRDICKNCVWCFQGLRRSKRSNKYIYWSLSTFSNIQFQFVIPRCFFLSLMHVFSVYMFCKGKKIICQKQP